MASGQQESEQDSGARRKSHARWLLGLSGVALALCLAWFFRPEPAHPPRSEGDAPVASRAPVPTPPVAVAAVIPVMAAGGAQPPAPPPDDPIEAYKQQTRYAPNSGRLVAGVLDLLEPNRRYEVPAPIQDTAGRGADGMFVYHLEADHYYYSGDDVVDMTLYVQRGSEPVSVEVTRGTATAEGASGAIGEEERLIFSLYEGSQRAELRLEEAFPDHHGPIQLLVEFEYEPGKRQEAGIRIFSTPADRIPARFTGRDSDALVHGSLVYEAGIHVDTPGFYRLDANLFSAEGEPIAFANFKGELAEGATRVPLEFFGLLLREAEFAGPYEVRNLRGYLFRDGKYPDRLRMRDAEGVHRTRAYDVASFSDDEFTSPHKQHMIELLQEDLQAGLGVDMPTAPSAPPGLVSGDPGPVLPGS